MGISIAKNGEVTGFVWHSILVRNHSDKDIDGDWEFNHFVAKDDGFWSDDDTTFGPVGTISGGETWPQNGTAKTACSEVYFPGGNKKVGKYQITAYTRISLYHKGKEVTKPSGGQRKNQRDIKSKWFDVR